MERSTSSPVRLPTLIGRQTALLETRRLLARTPLLTLTGPGGSGKTRLALEIVHEEGTAYPDGTWVVDLAALLEPSLLPEVTSATLGVQPTPNVSPTEQLIAFLRDRRALLVFDNCEHLLPSCAAFIEMLLYACARLRILVTSRESLDSPFEVVWPVPPLPVPVEDSRADARSVGAYESVQLFVLRAVAAAPAFLLTDDNAAVISRICRCLDGLPLAIELAARCVKALALEQIAAQLAQDLHILAGGYRTAPLRHQSLETAIEWSYRLLTSEEQTLFRRVSVLAGAFTLSAAAAVDGRSPSEVIDLLRRLIDKSLITVVERAGEARYRVLETLRQYGRQQLRGSGEHYDTCLRYSGWVMQLLISLLKSKHRSPKAE